MIDEMPNLFAMVNSVHTSTVANAIAMLQLHACMLQCNSM